MGGQDAGEIVGLKETNMTDEKNGQTLAIIIEALVALPFLALLALIPALGLWSLICWLTQR